MSKVENYAYLEDMSWTELASVSPKVPYWILVTGSTEQHGPHLPLGADTLVAERLARELTSRHHALIVGAIRVGVLHAFQNWPGLRVDHGTLQSQVRGLAQWPIEHCNRILIINGHDENHESLIIAARELNENHGTDVVVVEWAELVSDVIAEVSSSKSESHAGEGLTSVFLHWYPDRVREDAIVEGVQPQGGLTRDDLHTIKRAHHVTRFSPSNVPNGVLGDPRLASAAKGKQIVTALLKRSEALVTERGWL